MSVTRAFLGHLSVAILLLSTAGVPAAAQNAASAQAQNAASAQAQDAAPSPTRPMQVGERSSATFTVLVQGARIGAENVTVSRTEAGWLISGAGELFPPFDLVTRRFELQYGPDWQPVRLTVEGSLQGQLLALSTSFGVTSATSEMMQGAQRGSATQTITPRTIVLPHNFIAAYEGLAMRLVETPVGARLPIFVPGEGEYGATVQRITPRRIITPDGPVAVREFDLRMDVATGPVPVQLWVDERGRLARVVLLANGLVAVRDDIASVLTRVEKIRNPGDEDVFIRAEGFNLGATITRPQTNVRQAPAVILIDGEGPQDRDHMAYGVPIFGQLARRLSEAGYFVVRYDRRGSGQSGGRVENAGIDAYAGDVVSIVRWLRDRDDVDDDRIAAIGYFQGGAVALRAADREKRIKAVALLAVPGTTGADVTLEQQRLMLDRTGVAPEAQQLRIALQQAIIDAVLTGKGWDNVPAAVRRQADTPWFRSWLAFDPGKAVEDVDKPILIVQGALDAEVPPAHADLLEGYSRARGRPEADTRKVVVPGVNHLLVPATTGGVEEYPILPELSVSEEVAGAIVDWLGAVMPAR